MIKDKFTQAQIYGHHLLWSQASSTYWSWWNHQCVYAYVEFCSRSHILYTCIYIIIIIKMLFIGAITVNWLHKCLVECWWHFKLHPYSLRRSSLNHRYNCENLYQYRRFILDSSRLHKICRWHWDCLRSTSKQAKFNLSSCRPSLNNLHATWSSLGSCKSILAIASGLASIRQSW